MSEQKDVLNDAVEQIKENQKNANKENEQEVKEAILDLQKLLDQKEGECNSHMDKLLRTMAEYDNFRKRTTKEKADMYDKGVMDTVTKFLTVVDTCDRALGQIRMEELTDEQKAIYDGVVMMQNEFGKIFAELGVEMVLALGESFNPEVHNAVAHEENKEFPENQIVEEFQKGYKYNDKVIRPSMVKVVN